VCDFFVPSRIWAAKATDMISLRQATD